jgi:hypothetical protein
MTGGTVGTVTAVVVAVVAGLVAGYLHRRSPAAPPDAGLRWFEVHPPHTRLFGAAPEPVVLDTALRARLAGGLRTGPDTLVVATAPAARPTDACGRSYIGFAALQRPGVRGRVLVGAPVEVAARMPFSAAACGLLARPVADTPAGLRVVPPETAVTVAALPGWILGTDDAGRAVTVNLPPGATLLLTGPGAAVLSRTCPATGRRDTDVTVVTCTDEVGGDAWQEAWRDAWHPQCCRLIVDEAGGLDVDCPVPVDLTVRLGDGGGLVGDRRFRSLPLRI